MAEPSNTSTGTAPSHQHRQPNLTFTRTTGRGLVVQRGSTSLRSMRQNRCFPQSLQQVPHYAVLRQRLPEGALQDTQESMRGAGAGVRQEQRTKDGESSSFEVKRQEYGV